LRKHVVAVVASDRHKLDYAKRGITLSNCAKMFFDKLNKQTSENNRPNKSFHSG